MPFQNTSGTSNALHARIALFFHEDPSSLYTSRRAPQLYPSPGWSRHVDRHPAEGVDEFAARVALRDALTYVEASLGDALYKGVEGPLIHLVPGTEVQDQKRRQIEK